jgi:hypothetical protein
MSKYATGLGAGTCARARGVGREPRRTRRRGRARRAVEEAEANARALVQRRVVRLGFGRTVVSEIEAPIILVNMV